MPNPNKSLKVLLLEEAATGKVRAISFQRHDIDVIHLPEEPLSNLRSLVAIHQPDCVIISRQGHYDCVTAKGLIRATTEWESERPVIIAIAEPEFHAKFKEGGANRCFDVLEFSKLSCRNPKACLQGIISEVRAEQADKILTELGFTPAKESRHARN